MSSKRPSVAKGTDPKRPSLENLHKDEVLFPSIRKQGMS